MTERTGETVQVRCPLCDWTSGISEVDPDNPNGQWFAFSAVVPSYNEHFAHEHRPDPIRVLSGGHS